VTVTALEPGRLRRVFGAFPSGVVAIAAQVDQAPIGLAASSFTSVSIEPALVSVSVAKSSTTWPVLRRADHLGLSVLAAHHDGACRQLAGPAERRFDALDTSTTGDGAVLLDGAAATFDCTVHQEVDAGDHLLVLLRLHAADERHGVAPLVFHRSGFSRIQAELASAV
jgi:flavin reductase (DIM6/NTAB) family NADH-FMN oxidoreductase RutF